MMRSHQDTLVQQGIDVPEKAITELAVQQVAGGDQELLPRADEFAWTRRHEGYHIASKPVLVGFQVIRKAPKQISQE